MGKRSISTTGSGSTADRAKRSLELDAEECKRHRLAIHKEKLYKLLDSRPDIWPDLILLIESGYFDSKAEAQPDSLPACCNKWHLLSLEFILKALTGHVPNEVLDVLNKSEALKLLCFALHVDPGSALHSKNVTKLLELCHTRIASLLLTARISTSRLSEVIVDDKSPVTLNYCVFGHFILGDWCEQEQRWTKVSHLSGEVVPIPAKYTVTKEWEFLHNNHPIKAVLQHGFTTIPLHILFKEAGKVIQPPEYATMVGKAGRPAMVKPKKQAAKPGKPQEVQKLQIELTDSGDLPPAPPPGWGGAM